MSRLSSKTDRRPAKTPSAKPRHAANGLGAVLSAALDERRYRFFRRVGQASRHPTEKAIHDLRVATRRLIAILDVIRTLVPESGATKLRRKLKRHLDGLRNLRDLQVLILSARHLSRSFPVLRSFLALLLRDEKRLLKRAASEAAGMHGSSLERLLERAGSEMLHGLSDPGAEMTGKAVAVGTLAEAYARTNRLRRETDTGNTVAIHRFRLSFKKYRYMVEVLQPLLPGVDPELLKRMRRYQTMMGEIQDLEVLRKQVSVVSKQHGIPTGESFLPLERYFLTRQKALVSAFLASADELRSFWLPHW